MPITDVFVSLRKAAFGQPPKWMLPASIPDQHRTLDAYCQDTISQYDTSHAQAVAKGSSKIQEFSAQHQQAVAFCRALRMRHATPAEIGGQHIDDVESPSYLEQAPDAHTSRLTAQEALAAKISSEIGT